ncbi:MAG: ATP-binding protein [Terracidiphilus sp.]|jgi:signal transduction histidine kinase
MRLKTKLVLAIATLVLFISGMLSLVYVSQLLHSAVEQSFDTNLMVANQIRFALQNALMNGLRDRTVDPNNPAQLRNMEAEAVRNDEQLQAVIDSVNRYSLTVYDINIGDSHSSTLLSTNPDNEDNPLPVRPALRQLRDANPFQLMKVMFGPPRVFDVAVPLERNGAPFATVHVGVRTTFLRAVYEPWLKAALTLMGLALAIALVAAFLLGNLALLPLEQISRRLDYWTAGGESRGQEEETPRQDMEARVSHKIERFGQRMRNVQEVFSALKENLDRILTNLQDGILLFTGDGRAVLVSESARRFLPEETGSILGKDLHEVFDRATVLDRTLREAFDAGVTLVQEDILTETGRRIRVSLDFIHDGETPEGLGALVTLHDLESAEEIESELELSRRMAAIGRLTSGVGHEVKNPINAIVVHLELLRTKLGDPSSPALRHLEVIDSEIHRLDRVVQMLVDFSRPVELKLREQDLCAVVGDVLALAAAELSSRNVTLVTRMPSKPMLANIDADLLKQAVLNVIQNGAQAMPEGGNLEVVLEEERKAGRGDSLAPNNPSAHPLPQAWKSGAPGDRSMSLGWKSALIRITDQGPGIPDEIREKIFNLYFTTKSGGSGIGLAMTYRILQLHHGSIEVQSSPGRGAEFLMRIPLAPADLGRRPLKPANVQSEDGLSE